LCNKEENDAENYFKIRKHFYLMQNAYWKEDESIL
jgi:hypothetical protein